MICRVDSSSQLQVIPILHYAFIVWDLHFLRQAQVPLYCRNIRNFRHYSKGCHMFYVIINTGQKIWGIKFLPTRPGGEIANTFLLAKISGYISDVARPILQDVLPSFHTAMLIYLTHVNNTYNQQLAYLMLLVCKYRHTVPLSVRIIHLTVVEGAPSSRNLGKVVCVICFTWCTHSLSGVFFHAVSGEQTTIQQA